jgi:hypothetical protein
MVGWGTGSSFWSVPAFADIAESDAMSGYAVPFVCAQRGIPIESVFVYLAWPHLAQSIRTAPDRV